MSWLSLFFSGALKWLLKWGLAAIEWVLSDWRHIALTIAVSSLAWAAIVTIPNLRSESADNLAGWIAERNAHAGTVDNYIAAAAKAQADAEANVARVEAEQAEITQEITNDLENRLAVVDARYRHLVSMRSRDAAVDPGHADPAGLPDIPAPAAGADEAPGDHELPADPGQPRPLGSQAGCPSDRICLTFEEARDASADAERHRALIDWVWKQSAIRFNPQEAVE
ncbi:MAG: hypothetical protein AAGE86_02300 [Pseudomonadota bacterium]